MGWLIECVVSLVLVLVLVLVVPHHHACLHVCVCCVVPCRALVFGGLRRTNTITNNHHHHHQADTLQVTPRWLDSGTGLPPAVTGDASDVIDSDCEVLGTKLVCNVLRSVTPNTAQAKTSIDVTQQVCVCVCVCVWVGGGCVYERTWGVRQCESCAHL